LIYLPFPVSEDRLPAFLALAPRLGVRGLNVTTPYKEAVARLVQPMDEETRQAGMVNTVCFPDPAPRGCGTDGAGILDYLRGAGLAGEAYGVLGFGSTARSLAYRGWATGHPPQVVVTRRPAEVRSVLESWGAGTVAVADWSGLGPASPRLWVSTLRPEVPALPAEFWAAGGNAGVLLDMNYGPDRTTRMAEARTRGWRAADGLGPLCRQAALSLSLWLGEEVPARLFFRALGRTERSLRPER
jgi:shikimate dehydrogenase